MPGQAPKIRKTARKPLADDPEQPYGDINPDEVPVVEMPEEGNVHERIDDDADGEGKKEAA